MKIKICGLTRPQDVDAAVEAGADLVGFILVPWSPRAVSPDQAAELRGRVPQGVEAVGVFVDEVPDEVARLADELRLDRVQLHGAEPADVIDRFGPRAIKAYRLPHAGELHGDCVLLDRAFGEQPAADELEAHWAAALAEGRRRRVLLAGGLTPDNVAAAVRAARPWAVDAVRGTEAAPGVKDHERLRAFCRAARKAAR